MLNIDRHIAIQAGWVAGPAFSVAMMAAPTYFHLESAVASGFLFWGGIGTFLATILVVFLLSLHEEQTRKRVVGPIILMAVGALIFGGSAAWYFWPAQQSDRIFESDVREPHSKFKIERYFLERPAIDTPDAASILKAYVVNRGAIDGDKPMLNWNILAAQVSLSNDRIDVEFEDIYRKALKNLPPSRNASLIGPNIEGLYQIETPFINKASFDLIQNGELAFYLIAVLVWSDSSLEKEWWWITEHCTWQRKDFSTFHMCDDHNRTYKLRISAAR